MGDMNREGEQDRNREEHLRSIRASLENAAADSKRYSPAEVREHFDRLIIEIEGTLDR